MKISLLQDSNQKEQTFKCNLLYLLKLKKIFIIPLLNKLYY